MAPTLYMATASPPVRSVQVTAKALGLQLQEKQLNFVKGEHWSPEYLKLNPQHTVPTLVDDDGFTVWDSHAINAYLVSKYGKNVSLYPKDLKKRAIVDQRLHFDSAIAFGAIANIMRPVMLSGKRTIDDTDKENVEEVYSFLEAFLEGKQWMAGDSVTIADYNLYTTVTSLNVLHALNEKEYPRVAAWLKKVAALPEAEANKKGLAAFERMVRSKL